jgi:uncharacterized protein YjbI with pentapeptide repeats
MLLLGAHFDDVDFSGLEFGGFIAANSLIAGCDFSRVSFVQVDLGLMQYHRDWDRPIDWSKPLKVTAPRYDQTRYFQCEFRETKLPRRNTHFGNCHFDGCLFDDTLRSTVVDPILTQPAEFVGCRFTRRVSCVVFDGLVKFRGLATRLGRDESAFTENDFSEAELKSVDFRDIDLAAQRLPSGFRSYQ